jgi:hypothetical protein
VHGAGPLAQRHEQPGQPQRLHCAHHAGA